MANDDTRQPLTVSQAAAKLEDVLFPTPSDKKASAKPASEVPLEAVEKDEAPESLLSDESESPDSESDEPEEISLDSDDSLDEPLDEPDDVDDEPKPKPQTFRVKVRGEDVEVTQDELLNGYSRQADYTRSKQELADARKKFEGEEIPAVRERATRYAEGLTQIEEALKSLMPAEPDWDKLMVEAPETLATEKAKWDVYTDRISRLETERAKVEKQVDADRLEARKKVVQAENEKLLTAIPEWKDPKVANADKAALVTYAKELGFTDDDLSGVVNANTMLLLRNAYLWAKSQKKVPVIRETIERVRTATPGAKDDARPAVANQVKRRQRLAKTGRVKDAADAILNSDILD